MTLYPCGGLTNAMSLGECITVAIVACQAPSKVVSQVKVGTQCCVPLADKSIGCSFKALSVSRSVQTTEAVNESSSASGRHHDFPPTVKHKELQQCQFYHCDSCNYKTARLSALVVHKCRRIESRPSISSSTAEGEKSHQRHLYSCQFCDHHTNNLRDLEKHTTVHTGKRLFKCHFCPHSFSQKTDLNKHLRIHTVSVRLNAISALGASTRTHPETTPAHPHRREAISVPFMHSGILAETFHEATPAHSYK
ncbi:zinc finger protein 271-like isoform X2 [Dermacentor silvarum]|uniref:zinc finger protein 271-like isoform X2 n=1 Tax=Dermacentor silvarum TaxID=543639 RepID=UPI0021006BD0|nr:zinc finger protein 271-like isoform X2 [Dermacentor silvarum]